MNNIVTKEVEVNSRKSIAKKYKSLYKHTKKVKVEHLTPSSHIEVEVKCPICLKVYKLEYRRAKTFNICRSCYEKDIGNTTIGYWFVTNEKKVTNGQIYYRCICNCGIEKYVAKQSLVSGVSKSCGCFRNEKSKQRILDYNNKRGIPYTGTKTNWYTNNKWVLLRKNLIKNECEKCKSTEDLVLHHIYCARYFPAFRYKEDNLITLCRKCHQKYHAVVNISHPYIFENWLTI